MDRSELSAAHAVHAGTVRIAVDWSSFEPLARGALDGASLSALDSLVHTAAANGVKPILVVQGTPCWDSSAPPAIEAACVPGRVSTANAWPPTDDGAYGAFVAMLAGRYGSRLAAIEVWNEPDQSNEDYLAGPDKAEHYVAILKAAYPAIKRADPALPVLGGSFVGPNGTFLRLLYAHGIKGYYDGLAVHFYTLTLAALRATHEVQLQNGDTKPLWLDEFGWSSCWPRQRIQQEQGCVTARTQARNLADMTRELARVPYVAAEIVYKLRSTPNEDFGLLGPRGARKPAFRALARAFGSPYAKPSPLSLTLRVRHGAVVARGSGPVGDFLVLEALAGGRLRYNAIFTLDRFDRYTVTLPQALGTRGLLVRVYQYGRGRAGATVRGI